MYNQPLSALFHIMVSKYKAREIEKNQTSHNSSSQDTKDNIVNFVIMRSHQLVVVFGLLLAVNGSPQGKFNFIFIY